MKTVRLLFYPLQRLDDESDLMQINFDELLIKELHYPSKISNDEINDQIERLRNFQVVWVDSWNINDDNPEE